ncbi:putative glycoside hydrolase [Thalassotalea agarivorans]|uniref:ExoP galactose-binding-like domain-containing protein n=1 Tax=Thalassotalea agarivorans TaxID=349064 RepID=A0A1I0DYI0_THASX|nr:putative glycoside hydrolase [Thalassotalea agarivorans]SET37776.1 hypothetical protein SAMN05660429_01655 [Thalassotalea agarivorans]
MIKKMLVISTLMLSLFTFSLVAQQSNPTTDYYLAGKPQGSWEFGLQFNQVKMDNNTAKTTKGSLKATPANRNSEGDAVRLVWKPRGVKDEWGGVNKNVLTANILNTYTVANLLPYKDKGVLLLEMKVNKAPRENVELSMESNWDWQTRSTFALKNALKRMPKGEWAMLPIPLSCFNKSDFDFAKVTSPFILYTSGKMDIEISSIRVVQTDNVLTC